eukprot:PhM_4_TR6862/c1_g1_i1/m.55975
MSTTIDNSVVATTTEQWNSPTDHFRPKHKLISLYVDKENVTRRYLAAKTFVLDKWFMPFFTPFFFVATHISQRNRNLFLLENHLNYRPYKFRYDDWDNKY